MPHALPIWSSILSPQWCFVVYKLSTAMLCNFFQHSVTSCLLDQKNYLQHSIQNFCTTTNTYTLRGMIILKWKVLMWGVTVD
jgi:hypothetical protein